LRCGWHHRGESIDLFDPSMRQILLLLGREARQVARSASCTPNISYKPSLRACYYADPRTRTRKRPLTVCRPGFFADCWTESSRILSLILISQVSRQRQATANGISYAPSVSARGYHPISTFFVCVLNAPGNSCTNAHSLFWTLPSRVGSPATRISLMSSANISASLQAISAARCTNKGNPAVWWEDYRHYRRRAAQKLILMTARISILSNAAAQSIARRSRRVS